MSTYKLSFEQNVSWPLQALQVAWRSQAAVPNDFPNSTCSIKIRPNVTPRPVWPDILIKSRPNLAKRVKRCPSVDVLGRFKSSNFCQKLINTGNSERILSQMVKNRPIWSHNSRPNTLSLFTLPRLDEGLLKTASLHYTLRILPYLQMQRWQASAHFYSIGKKVKWEIFKGKEPNRSFITVEQYFKVTEPSSSFILLEV